MRFAFFVSLIIFCATPGVAQAAVFVDQESVFDVDTWRDLDTASTYYGELDNFPHTFEFLVKESMILPVQVSVKNGDDPVSLMVVREVTRGVEEAGRLMGDRETWETWKDGQIGLRFAAMTPQELQLEPGIYRLEISSPDNLGKYRLDVGANVQSVGYVGAVKETLVVHNFFGSWITALATWRIFVPIVLLLGIFYYWRRRARHS